MERVPLGLSDLRVTPLCLGTMTFGEQVDEPTAHALLDRAVECDINFIDTAEMYAVPARRETYGLTETIIGRWLAARPGMRERVVLATKVAGPSRGMDWIRGGSADLRPQDIVEACEASLRRLQTDVIDLYQIHWPARHVPAFGSLYFNPAKALPAIAVEAQLEAMDQLVRAGKVRHIGLSNETAYGVDSFIRAAEAEGLPRVATVQNPYCLVNRAVDNGLDESLYHHRVSLLAYSPLGFGLLTGKYDEHGIEGSGPVGRLALFASMQTQRWGRPEALDAARRYNALAREAGLTPASMAVAWCRQNWRVASTLIGVTTLAQLDENLAAGRVVLPADLLARIDALRWQYRDPAQ